MWLDNPKLRKWARRFEQDLKASRKRGLTPDEHLKWEVSVAMELQRLRGIDAGLRVAQDILDAANSNLCDSPQQLRVVLKGILDRAIESFSTGKA